MRTARLIATPPLLLLLLIAGCDDDRDATAPPEDVVLDADASPDMTEDTTTCGALYDTWTPPQLVDGEPLTSRWPATFEAYAPQRLVYIDALEIPEFTSGAGTCCRDFGAISRDKIERESDESDNQYAALEDALSGAGLAAFQPLLDDDLTAGRLVLLLDHRALDGEDDPDGFTLAALTADFAPGTDAQLARTGEGEFVLHESSFEIDSGEPRHVFDPAAMQGGELLAGSGTLPIRLPVADISIWLTLEGVVIEGAVEQSPDGLTYVEGTLSGYLTLENIVGTLNARVASPDCACLGLERDLIEFVCPNTGGHQFDSACVEDAHLRCEDGPSECVNIAASATDDFQRYFCDTFALLLPGIADIDLDGRPENGYEAISVGLRWRGVPATLAGP